MSKAFASVNHNILLKKLQDIGLSSSAILWFKGYLSNRYQAVRINTALSEPLLMRYGTVFPKEVSSVLCSSRLTPMTCHQSHNTVPRTATLMTLNCLCHSKCRTVNRLWPRWTMILLNYVIGVLIIGYSWTRTRLNWLYMEVGKWYRNFRIFALPSWVKNFTRRLC